MARTIRHRPKGRGKERWEKTRNTLLGITDSARENDRD